MTLHDPVCGMEIEPAGAFATRQHVGQTYYLCSQACAEKFDADPHSYARQGRSATTGIAEDGQGPLRIALPVGGLHKSGGAALEAVLLRLSGVIKASSNPIEGRVFVDYDLARVTVVDLLEAVRVADFPVAGHSLRLKVGGLYCAECASKIEQALKAVPAVLDATLNAATNEVKVDYSPAIGDLGQLNQAAPRASHDHVEPE